MDYYKEKRRYAIGSFIKGENIEGITKGHKYEVVNSGKDEIEVVNDYDIIAVYSSNCFEQLND